MTSRITRQKPTKRRSAGRPAADEAERRIESLLDVAARVFIENGYEGTTLEKIARRANASKQTLYSRYPSKSDLFTAMMNRICQAGFSRIADIFRPDRPLDEALKSYAWELIQPLVDKEMVRLNRTIICAAERFPDVGKMFWNMGPERAHNVMAEFVRDRITKGELRKGDPDELADLFLAMCSGRFWAQGLFGFQQRFARSEIDHYIDQVVQTFLSVSRPMNNPGNSTSGELVKTHSSRVGSSPRTGKV
jgi:TetR/AcrR family transcriptional regulator, mexJK operon transcriptional repressor